MANCWSGGDRELNKAVAVALPAIIGKVGYRWSVVSSFLRRGGSTQPLMHARFVEIRFEQIELGLQIRAIPIEELITIRRLN
jgi:hypothetical protein